MSWKYWRCGNCQKEYKVSKETDEKFLKHGIRYPICNRCKEVRTDHHLSITVVDENGMPTSQLVDLTDYRFSITVLDENGMPTSHYFPVHNITHSTKQLLVELLEGNPDVEEVHTQYL